jgi:thiol:disulfide interchange protein DsbD
MNIRRQLRTGSLVATFIGLSAVAAQANAAENPVHWSTAPIRKPCSAGSTFTAKLLARIDPGWHLYALEQDEGGPIPTEISLAGQSYLSLGTIRASKPIQLLDPNFDKRVNLYIEKAEFTLPLTVAAEATPGPHHAALHVRYQCCNETMCLPPRSVTVDLAVSIKAGK